MNPNSSSLILHSIMHCYIYLGKTNTPLQTGCVCKGSLAVHRSCFSKWMDMTENPFDCPVCKTGFSPKLVKQFFSEEEILRFGEDTVELELSLQVQHSIPLLVDNEGYYYFMNEYHQSIYAMSEKREWLSRRIPKKLTFAKGTKRPICRSFVKFK